MVRIGKKLFSWNSVKFRIAGLASEKLTSVDFDEKITDELVYASRRDGTAHGATSGKYEPGNVAMKFLADEWYGTDLLVNQGILGRLTLSKTLGLADTEFDIQLQFFEEKISDVGNQGVVTIYFPVCRIVNPKQSLAVGQAGMEVDITARVIEPIETNGARLASVLRTISANIF